MLQNTDQNHNPMRTDVSLRIIQVMKHLEFIQH